MLDLIAIALLPVYALLHVANFEMYVWLDAKEDVL